MRVNKILAVRNDRFGEFLLNIPAFQALKKNYPGAKLTLAVDGYVRQLAGRITFADEVISWEHRKHTLAEILKLSKELKRKKYDLCVIFNPGKESHIISYLAGIPMRAGYDRKWSFLLNYKIEDKKPQGLKHEVEYNLDLVRAIGIDTVASEIGFPLEVKKEDFPGSVMADLGIANDDFMAIHPWASNKEKEWPQVKFRQLIAGLIKESGDKIVVVGGKEEVERSFELCKDLSVINLTGKTTLMELAALLKRAKLLISADSGPMHLAAISGAKVVALFRKGPPAVSARRWGPVGTGHIIIEAGTVSEIEVSEVLNGIKKILG